MRRILAALAALALLAGGASAQCRVPSSSNEGKLLAFYAVPLIFSAAAAPDVLTAGSIRLGFEGELIPKPSAEIQKTGKCFLQKSEHTSLSPVIGRPRISVALPGSFVIEASYLPPVRIANAKPNLASIALSQARSLGAVGTNSATLLVRANATFGNVKGPITCPRSSLQTAAPTAACYGSNPSNDTFEPRTQGLDVLLGLRPTGSTLSYYGGVGANRADPRFQVGFTDGNGGVDRTKVRLESALTRISLTAGATVNPRAGLDLGAQVYSVPQDATTIRVHAGLSFR